MEKDLKVTVDITGTDQYKAMAALLGEVISTHPHKEQYERAFYELIEKPAATDAAE